jgi:hypothetical protein
MRNILLILGIVSCLVGGGFLASSPADTAPSGYDLLVTPDTQPETQPAPLPEPLGQVSVCVNGQCSLVTPQSDGTILVTGQVATRRIVSRPIVAPVAAARFNAPVGRPLLRIVSAPVRVVRAIRARRRGR